MGGHSVTPNSASAGGALCAVAGKGAFAFTSYRTGRVLKNFSLSTCNAATSRSEFQAGKGDVTFVN